MEGERDARPPRRPVWTIPCSGRALVKTELTRVDVLIVDDDEAIRSMLRRAMQRFGLVCTEARDSIEALDRLQTINCAVILLDLMMPRLDGHGFIEQFTGSRQPDQSPLILAISASGDQELLRAKADAVHAIVRKPFEVQELAEIVALCAATLWASRKTKGSLSER